MRKLLKFLFFIAFLVTLSLHSFTAYAQSNGIITLNGHEIMEFAHEDMWSNSLLGHEYHSVTCTSETDYKVVRKLGFDAHGSCPKNSYCENGTNDDYIVCRAKKAIFDEKPLATYKFAKTFGSDDRKGTSACINNNTLQIHEQISYNKASLVNETIGLATCTHGCTDNGKKVFCNDLPCSASANQTQKTCHDTPGQCYWHAPDSSNPKDYCVDNKQERNDSEGECGPTGGFCSQGQKCDTNAKKCIPDASAPPKVPPIDPSLSSYKVHPIVIFPTNYPVDQGVVTYVNKMMGDIQNWFGQNNDGKTFKYTDTIPLKSEHDSLWFWCGEDGTKCTKDTNSVWTNIQDELRNNGFKTFDATNKDLYLVVFMGGGGWSGGNILPGKAPGGALAAVGDLEIYPEMDKNCDRVKSSYFKYDAVDSLKRCTDEKMATTHQGTGATAHELGHALGLNHPDTDGYDKDSVEAKSTIMQNHFIFPKIGLTAVDKAMLAKSPYFSETIATTPTPTDAPNPNTNTCENLDNRNNSEFKCFSNECGSETSPYTEKTTSSGTYSCQGSTGGNICCKDPVQFAKRTPPLPPGGGGNSSQPAGSGYCAGANRENPKEYGNPNCKLEDAEYSKEIAKNGNEYSEFCDQYATGNSDYLYKCVSTSTTPTPTPTPYTPLKTGGSCKPAQGPWQCEAKLQCVQACNPISDSCTQGKCCPTGWSWDGSTCVAPTPTTPAANKPVINTPGQCNDVVLSEGQIIPQVCEKAASCSTGQHNSGGDERCSQLYGNSQSGYACCQKAAGTEAGGSSCNIAGRPCDPSSNTSKGSNITCSGCGGYCVPTGNGGICTNAN